MDRRLFVSALALAAAVSAPLLAGASEKEAPILVIDGQVDGGKEFSFTRAEFEKLGLVTLKTATPWHQGVQTFEGVPMSKLMDVVKAKGKAIDVVALNKYRTTIPIEDFAKYEPILAVKRDGQYMAVRDKGPLFVIYPYDRDAALRSEQFYGRSAWQVATITVK